MDLLGPSIENLKDFCENKFSLKTALNIGLQILNVLKEIHKCGYIHRDVKPDNLVVGLGKMSNKVFFVDFGMSTPYK